MKVVDLTCINCPLGCQLRVEVESDEIISVTGYTCKRGEKYAHSEIKAPKRCVTSTVKCGSKRVSVKTMPNVDKDKIFDVMRVIHSLELTPPIKINEVLLSNIADTGSDLVATSNVD